MIEPICLMIVFGLLWIIVVGFKPKIDADLYIAIRYGIPYLLGIMVLIMAAWSLSLIIHKYL